MRELLAIRLQFWLFLMTNGGWCPSPSTVHAQTKLPVATQGGRQLERNLTKVAFPNKKQDNSF